MVAEEEYDVINMLLICKWELFCLLLNSRALLYSTSTKLLSSSLPKSFVVAAFSPAALL